MFSPAARKLGPWSVSKAKLVKTCPLAFKLKYIDKIPEEGTSLITRVGEGVHRVLELVEQGLAVDEGMSGAQRALHLTPKEMEGVRGLSLGIRAFAETLDQFRRSSIIERELTEEKLGLDVELRPVDFSAGDVFFRGVWDLGFVLGDRRVAIIDHKTARKKDLRWFAEQLRSYAVMALAHFPDLTRVWPAIHFVGAAEVVWGKPSTAAEVRGGLTAWFVRWIDDAAERAERPDPQPIVSKFCEFCGYRPRCPAHTIEAAGERLVALSTRRGLHR